MSETAPKVCCVDIKRLLYGPTSLVTGAVTAATLSSLIKNSGIKEVENIHQDTWTIEESDASQDSYRNQLTGKIYRYGRKQEGDVTLNFTIGQYDYATKAEFLGGEVSEDGKSWSRASQAPEIEKLMIAQTVDDQWLVAPRCNINGKEANTDKAVGLGIVASIMEPKDKTVKSEYWFDGSLVTTTP